MQIALTSKLSKAAEMKPEPKQTEENPLFTWMANWITAGEGKRAEHTLVLVNHANRYTVAAYPVKRKDLTNMTEIIQTAIRNTLLAENLDPAVVDEYIEKAGDISYVKNTDRKATAWANHAGSYSAFWISRLFDGKDHVFNDTIGAKASKRPVKDPNEPDEYIEPSEKMKQDLSNLTQKAPYNYRAFELLVTLDLYRYKASRRIIVPADISFQRLHHIFQSIFGWSDYHLYDFTVVENPYEEPLIRLVPYEEDLEYDARAVLMNDKTLEEYLPLDERMVYTYDYGDNWEHVIELVRIIENHGENSPYLLEASGQTPPEDVGGVGGYLEFLDILQDPEHPEHDEMKEWSGYWEPELSDWQKKPRLIEEY